MVRIGTAIAYSTQGLRRSLKPAQILCDQLLLFTSEVENGADCQRIVSTTKADLGSWLLPLECLRASSVCCPLDMCLYPVKSHHSLPAISNGMQTAHWHLRLIPGMRPTLQSIMQKS